MEQRDQTSWAGLLRNCRQRMGLTKTQLARALSVSVAYVSKLESGQRPPPERQRQVICEVLDLSDDEGLWFHTQAELERADPASIKYLLRLTETVFSSGRQPESTAKPAGSQDAERLAPAIPIINKVAAGHPQEFTDLDYPAGIADDYLSVPDITDPNAFAFYVQGDSMEPDFVEKSLVIASPNTIPFEGDPCFVRFSAVSPVSGCTFKRVYFMADGKVRLVPINRRYPEQVYRRDDISGLWPVVRQYRQVRRHETGAPTGQ